MLAYTTLAQCILWPQISLPIKDEQALLEEYKLIEEKKSILSRTQRDQITEILKSRKLI